MILAWIFWKLLSFLVSSRCKDMLHLLLSFIFDVWRLICHEADPRTERCVTIVVHCFVYYVGSNSIFNFLYKNLYCIVHAVFQPECAIAWIVQKIERWLSTKAFPFLNPRVLKRLCYLNYNNFSIKRNF